MNMVMMNALNSGQREILIKALVNDRLDVFVTMRNLLEEAVMHGLKGFSDYTDAELVKAAVDADLGITLADIGFDESGKPMIDDWLACLRPGDVVHWTDPAEKDARANIMAFHDLSDGFWDSLTADQKEELAREAGENLPGSSGIYNVFLIFTESGRVESKDSALLLNNKAGSVAEVLARELNPPPGTEATSKVPPSLEYRGYFICNHGDYWRIKNGPSLGHALHHGSFESSTQAMKYIDDGHLKGG